MGPSGENFRNTSKHVRGRERSLQRPVFKCELPLTLMTCLHHMGNVLFISLPRGFYQNAEAAVETSSPCERSRKNEMSTMPASGSPEHHSLRAGFLIKNQPLLVGPREGEETYTGAACSHQQVSSLPSAGAKRLPLLPASYQPPSTLGLPLRVEEKHFSANYSADSLLSPNAHAAQGPRLCPSWDTLCLLPMPSLYYIFSFPGPPLWCFLRVPSQFLLPPKQLTSLSRHASTPISHHFPFRSTLEYLLNASK